jgi:hypothetical protein
LSKAVQNIHNQDANSLFIHLRESDAEHRSRNRINVLSENLQNTFTAFEIRSTFVAVKSDRFDSRRKVITTGALRLELISTSSVSTDAGMGTSRGGPSESTERCNSLSREFGSNLRLALGECASQSGKILSSDAGIEKPRSERQFRKAEASSRSHLKHDGC